MSDKKKPGADEQLSMPLIIPETEIKAFVKQHWNVTFARQKKISVYAKRIMAFVISQIQEGDMALRPYYQMHIKDIVVSSQVNRQTAYKEVKKALNQLMEQIWQFEDIRTKRYSPRHLVDTTKMVNADGFEYGYDNGIITVVLNPALKPYFIAMGHHSTFGLPEYMKFESWYSQRIFEMLEAYKDTGKWYVNIDEYRILMDCEHKYPSVKDLINKTLYEPLQELSTTRMAFDYKPIYPQRKGRGRPPIVALEFTLKNPELKKVPKHWMDNEADARLIEALREFKVTDKNIAKYAPYIPVDDVWKLIKEWRVKEQSSNRINDKLRYCNKVYVAVGKEAEIEKASIQDTLNEVGRRDKKKAKGSSKKSEPKRYVADEKEMKDLYEAGSWKEKGTFKSFMERNGYFKEKGDWVKYH